MPDITIPDAAVEAFKAAWHAADDEGRQGNRVSAGLTAAAPHIAAQALRDAADEDFTTESHIRRVGYLRLRDRADRIEAGNG